MKSSPFYRPWLGLTPVIFSQNAEYSCYGKRIGVIHELAYIVTQHFYTNMNIACSGNSIDIQTSIPNVIFILFKPHTYPAVHAPWYA